MSLFNLRTFESRRIDADLLFLYKFINSVAFCPPLLQLINFYASAMSSRFTRSFLIHRYGSFLVNFEYNKLRMRYSQLLSHLLRFPRWHRWFQRFAARHFVMAVTYNGPLLLWVCHVFYVASSVPASYIINGNLSHLSLNK